MCEETDETKYLLVHKSSFSFGSGCTQWGMGSSELH